MIHPRGSIPLSKFRFIERGRYPKILFNEGSLMKRLLVLFGMMLLASGFAYASTTGTTAIPGPIAAFFDTVISIVVQKGILLGGIAILVIAGIVSFVNKSWAPMAYAVVGLIIMVLALPFVTSMIDWSSTADLTGGTTTP